MVAAAVRVEASGDVTVHVVSVSDWSTGSYVALPLDKLGTDYYVMTLPFSNETRALWQVCVVSLVDNTVVKLNLSRLQPVRVGVDIASSFTQSTATLVLQKYQTFQVIKAPQTTNNNIYAVSQKKETSQSICAKYSPIFTRATLR